MNENEIRERLDAIAEELRAIDTEAGDAALTEEQQTRFDALLAEQTEQRSALERREARRAALADLPARARENGNGDRRGPEVIVKPDAFAGDARSLSRPEARDRALRVLEDRNSVSHLSERQLAHIDRLIRSQRTRNVQPDMIARRMLLTENEHYRSAFFKISAFNTPVLTAEEARAIEAFNEFRAMSIGTDAAGGFGVPVLIDPTINLVDQGSPNDILTMARVETITNDEWKGVSATGSSWSFDAEAAAVSDDSPTLAQPNVPTYTARGFIPFSIEVGMDYPGFAQEMSVILSEGYSELLASKLTTGSGSAEPTGIVTALDANTNVEVTPTTDGAFVAADVAKLWDNLPIKYRRRPSVAWMGSTDVENEIRSFGATYGANMSVDITQEGITNLYGRRFAENDFMADFTGSTGAANLLIVGDWKQYLVAQRAGMSVELVPHLFDVTNNRPTGQRGWFAWARVGADSINDLGFRLLQNQ